MPPLLSANYAARRGTAKEIIKEILVADLGDMTSSYPYLIVSLHTSLMHGSTLLIMSRFAMIMTT